jgi:hypothetical protein
LQVGEVDLVGVGKREASYAGGREVERGGAAQAARSNDQDAAGTQLFLPLDANLVEEDVTGIPEKLLVVN